MRLTSNQGQGGRSKVKHTLSLGSTLSLSVKKQIVGIMNAIFYDSFAYACNGMEFVGAKSILLTLSEYRSRSILQWILIRQWENCLETETKRT